MVSDARVFRHTGEIVGRPNSSVKLRVERHGDGVYELKELRFKRVPGVCGGEQSNEISLGIGRSVTAKSSGRFRRSFENKDGAVLAVGGRVLRNGRVVRGNLRTSRFDAGDETCKVDKVRFKTHSVPEKECGEFLHAQHSEVCLRLRGGHRPTRISSFRFDGLPVACDNGSAVPATGAAVGIPIARDGRFKTNDGKITGPFNHERILIKGVIAPSRARRASGTVELSYRNRRGISCGTGPLAWEA